MAMYSKDSMLGVRAAIKTSEGNFESWHFVPLALRFIGKARSRGEWYIEVWDFGTERQALLAIADIVKWGMEAGDEHASP